MFHSRFGQSFVSVCVGTAFLVLALATSSSARATNMEDASAEASQLLAEANAKMAAESFEDAARLACKIQLHPESLATHFIARDRHGGDREIWAESK
ncbi:MAG TPA: hypothetical protein PLJ71_22575 [Candidatus Hydrogenedentes bacterium]|nr:hypothetical protein [Candidatus Hydrogenedentota bacterium]